MTKAEVIVADIGSTITKLSAFTGLDGDSPRFLAQEFALTTVEDGDVTLGFENARKKIEDRFDVDTTGARVMAASSAAGGLRMTVHGLTRSMTLRAAREASLGAGAIVTYTTAGSITRDAIKEIRAIRPNIILLAGGVDYGEQDIVVGNAKALASLGIKVPVIYAGNISVRNEVKRTLEASGMNVFVADNVYPQIDELNIDPVRKIIQDVFSKHITTAPGMDKVKAMISGDVIPTPGAVMKSVELLYPVLGDLMAVDVGGATTDVHSVAEGSAKYSKMMVSPEPLAKRTVEGDLGVFINARHIVEASDGTLEEVEIPEPIPQGQNEKTNIKTLSRWAVDLSVWRHAGEVRAAYGAYGRKEVVEDRDLTAVKTIIGTGGALIRLDFGKELLSTIRQDPRERKLLPPSDARVLIDRNYIMASVGVLSQQYRQAAVTLLLDSLGHVCIESS